MIDVTYNDLRDIDVDTNIIDESWKMRASTLRNYEDFWIFEPIFDIRI